MSAARSASSLGAGLVVNADFSCEAGVFGAPDAACGSDEFDCGHAKAADTNNRDTITNGERFIANKFWMQAAAAQMAL